MAGLLAWAADVVGGGGSGRSDDEHRPNSTPLIFTPEQLAYVQELDRKSATLNLSIQDLRLRLPPSDISQRLPDLHAHSLASNNALALQLDAHSATKQQTHMREIRLQEENAEYQKAISSCEIKIQEKLQEADLLQNKLKEFRKHGGGTWRVAAPTSRAATHQYSLKNDLKRAVAHRIQDATHENHALLVGRRCTGGRVPTLLGTTREL
ncbi:hypothetical protein OROGR_006938 [Orobanche gracilis]